MRLRKILFLSLLFALVLIGLALPTLHAQDTPVITLSLPEFVQNLVTPELLAEFEQANGVKVNVVSSGLGFFAAVFADVETHLDDIADSVSAADVVLVSSSNLSVEATRAGLYLDLAPLTSADAALNPDDFFPAIWQSVQWDGGVWAIPVSADLTMLVYDQAAFDAAGLSYPNERWTLDDLANAARALTEYDANGNVSQPGLLMLGSSQVGMLLRSLLGEGLYDNSVLPNAPRFSNPTLEPLLTTAAELLKEGVVSSTFSGDFNEVPMRIINSFGFIGFDPNAPEPGISLLPGGKAGLEVQGFAVSSGTRYPELAYALAKFLSTRPEISNSFLGATPARQSLVGVEAPPPDDNGGFAVVIGGPTNQAAVDLGLANALPMSELRFAEYLSVALQKVNEGGLDAHAALQEAELAAVTNLQAAADRKANTVVSVATPVPTPVLSAGEVSLTFGYLSFVQPIANLEEWERAIAEFVANDPQVRQVVLDTNLRQPDTYPEVADCWYLPLNYVPQADLTTVLNLDPYLDVDSSFDKADVMGGILSQLQRDNKTWALPVAIQPQALSYNSQLFAQAGLPEPSSGWTTDQFKNALTALKPNLAEDEAPFASRSPGGTYLLLLMAAYGGIPLDYRTTPPTINFTDATNVDAIRQVLDLAKDGYIDYQELGGTGAIVAFFGAGGDENQPAIYTTSLGGLLDSIPGIGGQAQEQSNYKLATYPRGSQYSAATFDLSTAYISATTPNPDACYRWMSYLARHPELFGGMPARTSLLTDPAVMAAQTPDETAFYQTFAAILRDPNTVAFPSAFAGASAANFLLERWLNVAFDRYVLEDGDLEAELADAQTYATAFLECTASLPPFDPAVGDQFGFFQQYIDCATMVDPSMEGVFPQIGGQ